MAVADARTPASESSQLLLFKSPMLRFIIRSLILYLSLAGILLWMLSLYNFIKDLEESVAVFAQDAMEVLTSSLQLAFFILVA